MKVIRQRTLATSSVGRSASDRARDRRAAPVPADGRRSDRGGWRSLAAGVATLPRVALARRGVASAVTSSSVSPGRRARTRSRTARRGAAGRRRAGRRAARAAGVGSVLSAEAMSTCTTPGVDRLRRPRCTGRARVGTRSSVCCSAGVGASGGGRARPPTRRASVGAGGAGELRFVDQVGAVGVLGEFRRHLLDRLAVGLLAVAGGQRSPCSTLRGSSCFARARARGGGEREQQCCDSQRDAPGEAGAVVRRVPACPSVTPQRYRRSRDVSG